MAEEIAGDKIEIDPELAALIPKLSSEELAGLEAQILRDGCIDPLKVWDHDGMGRKWVRNTEFAEDWRETFDDEDKSDRQLPDDDEDDWF